MIEECENEGQNGGYRTVGCHSADLENLQQQKLSEFVSLSILICLYMLVFISNICSQNVFENRNHSFLGEGKVLLIELLQI